MGSEIYIILKSKMISDNFTEILQDFEENTSSEVVKSFNDKILILEHKQDNESEAYFFKIIRNISNTYIKNIVKDSFQWTKLIGQELKDFFTLFHYLKSPMFFEFANTRFLQSVFNIRYFNLFCGINLGRVGGSESYDESLRAISYMLSFFGNAFLRKELAYKPSLKTTSFHLYDPFYREKVREQNQNDLEIKNFFFSENFNIKEFSLMCLQSYFPNVSWRWLGGKQFAHYMTLKIILDLFEYGLWKLEELDDLLSKIYSASEILSNLESAIKKDCDTGRFSAYQAEGWTKLSTKCRKKIGSILLHIMIMHLDHEVMCVLPKFQIPVSSFFSGYPLFTSKTNITIENLFYTRRFKKKRLYTYFSYSLITYLIRPMQFKNAPKILESNSYRKIIALLLGYVSELENNMFNISLNTIQPEAFSFYLLAQNSELNALSGQYQAKFKSIIENIQCGSFGVLNYENVRFLNEVSSTCNEIIDFFNKLPKKADVIYGLQLSFLLHSIPQHILSLINFIVEMGPTEKHVFRTIKTCVVALITLCYDNNQAINQIFSHYNYQHILVLIENDVLNGVYLIVKLFGKASTLYILEKNNEIFEQLLDNYFNLLEDFEAQIDAWNDNDEVNIESRNMVAIMIYNKLFKRILKNSYQRTFKFQLLISSRMKGIPLKFLKIFAKKKLQPNDKFEENPMQNTKLENLLTMVTIWDSLDNKDKISVAYEAMYLTLGLFDQSIKKVYTEKTYNQYHKYFKENGLSKYLGLLSSNYGLKLLKVIMKIFSTCMIFHQNHLLDRQNLQVEKNNVYAELYLRSEQTNPHLYDQLLIFIQEIKNLIKGGRINPILKDFLFTSYLPAIFKLYSGILTHMTENHFKDLRSAQRIKFVENIKLFLDFVLYIHQCLEENEGPRVMTEDTNIFILSFKNLYTENNAIYFYQQTLNPEIDMFRITGYQMMDSIATLYLYNEAKVPHISELVRYNYYQFEESVMDVMNAKLQFLLKFRNEFNKPVDKKIVFWDNTKKSLDAYRQMQADSNSAATQLYYKIKNFDFEMPHESDIKFIKNEDDKYTTKMSTLDQNETNSPPQLIDWTQSEKYFYIQKVITYLKERYKFMKSYFLENNNNNQIFVVFRLEDIIKHNVQFFVNYFCEEIKTMDLTFEDLNENFFTNELYFSLFILMDNLIRTSHPYRNKFYETIIQESNLSVMDKIWRLHKMLLDYSLYSTFLDSSWKQIFTSFFLVSNFIQNLCEDNFYLFKTWFAENYNISSDKNLCLLETLYANTESAFKNTELAQYSREQLSLYDKPELFFVYNRLIECMNEFINGGKTFGQTMIYQNRTDIWVGIIMRLVDDVDSTFYVLKFNILLYITSMLEGQDKTIVEFIASNFSVNRTFRLIVRLLKKLYVRALLVKEKKKHIKFGERGIVKSIFTITEETEQMYKITSVDIILDFYKKYQSTFSDHIIMNSIVSLYSFVRVLASNVVRYKNFLEEINGIEQAVFIDGSHKHFQNETYDMESITIWHFIKSIIVEMEILYKDINQQKNTKPSLMVHHFKRLPICFFLTTSLKKNFMFYVKIDTIDLKHDEFFEKLKYHKTQMKNFRFLYKMSKFLFYTSTEEAFRYYMIFLYLLAISINVVFLVLYRSSDNQFLQFNPLKGHKSIMGLAMANGFFGLVFLIYWFIIKYPIIKRIKWDEYFLVNKRSKKPPLSAIIRISFWRSILMKRSFRTFFFHIILSILGLCVSPFFYTLLLFLVVDLSFLVYSVIISFVKNYDKLAYTLLMIMVIINFFAYLASDAFGSDYTQNKDTQYVCASYFTCLMNGLNIGLRAGGGIADKMTFNGNNTSKTFEGRFFFDVMFFILINIILLGMFFGIIVDSFKESRDNLEMRSYHEQNICFTCGLKKDRLEKASLDFNQHLKYHDIWNYLFYIIYLQSKPQNSYDGIDLYIKENIDTKHRRAWMPIGCTMKYEDANNLESSNK